MSLSDKSKESRAIARLVLSLCENDNEKEISNVTKVGCYNFAANRFYYSCFQKLHSFLEEKYNYNNSSGSSHENLINFIDEKIARAMEENPEGMILLRSRSMKGDFNTLKRNRVKADYKKDNITENDLVTIKRATESFDEAFNMAKSNLWGGKMVKSSNKNNVYISQLVDKLNSITKLENKVVYSYNEEHDWYDITHSVNDLIQNDDEIAMEITSLLIRELHSKNIYNYSFYEDVEIVKRRTAALKERNYGSLFQKVVGKDFINEFSFELDSRKVKLNENSVYDLKVSTDELLSA